MPGPPKGTRIGGRAKGTPNKKTFDLAERLAALNCDPVEGLAKIAKNPKTSPQLRADVLCDLMGYIYPKRKAVEVTGEGGGALTIALLDRALDDDSGHNAP